jgi:hypothetical protein
MRATFAVLVLLANTPPVSPPTRFEPSRPVNVQDVYLPPQPAELAAISFGMHTKQTVRTRGTVEFLDASDSRYFALRDSAARVVLIPMPELADALRRMVGQRVEVDGHVRELERNQGTCRFRGQEVPQSVCEDPELPPKPDLDRASRIPWPNMSITVWAVRDAARASDKKSGDPDSLSDLLDSAGRETITAVGRFCGANLCGGMTDPPPSRDAWVLADGSTAIWVVGRKPKGNGFSLDPAYKGDTKRWLEVKGRLEACGPSRCLRASSVALKPRPEDEEP